MSRGTDAAHDCMHTRCLLRRHSTCSGRMRCSRCCVCVYVSARVFMCVYVYESWHSHKDGPGDSNQQALHQVSGTHYDHVCDETRET